MAYVAERFITLWRKTGAQCLDWDQYVSESADEARTVERNIMAQGVRQWSTFRLGELVRNQATPTPGETTWTP